MYVCVCVCMCVCMRAKVCCDPRVLASAGGPGVDDLGGFSDSDEEGSGEVAEEGEGAGASSESGSDDVGGGGKRGQGLRRRQKEGLELGSSKRGDDDGDEEDGDEEDEEDEEDDDGEGSRGGSGGEASGSDSGNEEEEGIEGGAGARRASGAALDAPTVFRMFAAGAVCMNMCVQRRLSGGSPVSWGGAVCWLVAVAGRVCPLLVSIAPHASLVKLCIPVGGLRKWGPRAGWACCPQAYTR